MPSVVCSCVLCWRVEVGWSLASFRVMCLWKKRKTIALLAFLSLMHAAICMYIADIEMHMVERFLNSPNHRLSSFFFFLSRSLCSTSPHPNHLRIFAKSLQCRSVWYLFSPFVWNILTNSSSPPLLSLLFLISLILSLYCEPCSCFISSLEKRDIYMNCS